MLQAEDRAHRIGQRNSVLAQYLVLEGSLDARMAHILVDKMAVADLCLDDLVRAELSRPVLAVKKRVGYC
jgi:SWI/SNF-related matrix-associated actin-dependent regulator 1 of chromatin subfamily A